MELSTIISAQELRINVDDPDLVVMDCRYYLEETTRGYQEYLDGHIPGAIYVNLDQDLSGKIIPGQTGRHPLPSSQAFADRLSSWGVDASSMVVAYDSMSGAMAARLWWMLRWLGHEKTAVLNGGWKAWEGGDFPQESQSAHRKPKLFTPVEHPELIADLEFVDRVRLDPDYLLLDARSPERYWGLKETIDVKAGHIPGAVTAPYADNLDAEGYFLPVEDLKARYDQLLGGVPEENTILYCGSGVTSIHNMIAMLLAGYKLPKLYPGSWSEWTLDPLRPIGP